MMLSTLTMRCDVGSISGGEQLSANEWKLCVTTVFLCAESETKHFSRSHDKNAENAILRKRDEGT